MTLKIETYSAAKGGNAFFKAVTHPEVAAAADALLARLVSARSVAVYDPLGFADGFWACRVDRDVRVSRVLVQRIEDIGAPRLGIAAEPVTALGHGNEDLLFVAAFDAAKLVSHIGHLIPPGMAVVTLDAMRLDPALVPGPGRYLNPLNFATNFALFRDSDGHHTTLVLVNYWQPASAADPFLALTLFDAAGAVLARWHEALGALGAVVTIDSRAVRARFDLPAFDGQLFIHAVGTAPHDNVKYSIDTGQSDGPSLSATHDSNAWPADFYAGLPAPDAGERVILWLQNCLPIPIPAGAIALNRMGAHRSVPYGMPVPPYATVPLDVGALLPDVCWPEQIEIAAGRHLVRPRYEITRAGRTWIAHPNVERTDLGPQPGLAAAAPLVGKGYLLPSPLLPPERWKSMVLPTPMAREQAVLPIEARLYDPSGTEIGHHRFGRLPRDHAEALDLDTLLGGRPAPAWGHIELTYDFAAGDEADGWLHALFRFEDRASGHAADSSFGAHMFNSILTWRDEPQAYVGGPPGLSTRLFLRLGTGPFDTLCHLIYPASTPWSNHSSTDLILHDSGGTEVARQRLAIPCGGSHFWLYSEMFGTDDRTRAAGGYVIVRDTTCRLFGYHGLCGLGGRFSLDHMFGF